MPTLKRDSPNLRKHGPLLQVRLEPVLALQEDIRADGDEVPSASALVLIDTGASNTLIQTEVMSGLGFESLGTVFLRTPTTTEPVARQQYHVRVVIAAGIAFEVDIVEAPLTGQGIQGLIGRDILERVVLTYDGPRSRFSVKMP